MDILSKFSENLKELMFERKIKNGTLAKALEVKESTISRYINGKRLPTYGNFVKMLEYFQCSADFLIGKLEYPPTDLVFQSIPPFSERFRYLLETHKMTQYALHQKTNFSYDNFNQWLKGTTAPFLDNLEKLANAFNCSVDYLIGHVR